MTSSTLSGLGRAIRWLRERQGRKQYQVADRAGITKGMLSAYETGRQHPSLDTLEKLLDTLGCTLHDLHNALQIVNERPEAMRPTRVADPGQTGAAALPYPPRLGRPSAGNAGGGEVAEGGWAWGEEAERIGGTWVGQGAEGGAGGEGAERANGGGGSGAGPGARLGSRPDDANLGWQSAGARADAMRAELYRVLGAGVQHAVPGAPDEGAGSRSPAAAGAAEGETAAPGLITEMTLAEMLEGFHQLLRHLHWCISRLGG